MAEANITQEVLAELIGRCQPVVSEILNGKRAISPEIAIELETALRSSSIKAHKLLYLQARQSLNEAQHSGKSEELQIKARLREEFPISEMQKRGWIQKCDDIKDTLREVLSFAGSSSSLDEINPPFPNMALARQSPTLGYLSPNSRNSRAWLFRVRQLAKVIPVKDFSHEAFVNECMPVLRKLVRNSRGILEVPQTLARYGVRFLVVERLEKTKLDGAATWLDEGDEMKSPVIALTLRHDRIDNFWFTLAHELQHIVLRHRISIDVEEDDEINQDLIVIERQADAAAREWLIPHNRLQAFIERRNGRFTEEYINAFAELIDVHPGVLVGRLQYLNVLPYKKFATVKVPVRPAVLLASMHDGFGAVVTRSIN